MIRCAKGFLFLLLFSCMSCLFGADTLTYGIETHNSEYIRKGLAALSTKDAQDLFKQDMGETIAKAYIDEASGHPLALLRMEGYFGALHEGNGASALILEKALQDPNDAIRLYAQQAATSFFDAFIQHKLIDTAKTKRGEEKILAFQSLAFQDSEKAYRVAQYIFDDPSTPLSEKIAIGEIISRALSTFPPSSLCLAHVDTLLWLGTSHPQLVSDDMLQQALFGDSFPNQLAALEYMGVWGKITDTLKPQLEKMIASSIAQLRAKAAWVCICHVPELREESISSLDTLAQMGDKEAALVSETICRLGKTGIDVASSFYKDSTIHPLCRLNSALHLLRYRALPETAPYELLVTLKSLPRPLQFLDETPGRPIILGDVGDDEVMSQRSRFADASVRCSLLGLVLNTSDDPQVEKLAYIMAEGILKKKSWGPLFEGGAEFFFQVSPQSLSFVRKLSMSLYEEVRIQTAGILAALGQKQEALEILRREFEMCSFEGKMVVLAILPQFTFQDAIPFLATSMKDRSNLVRARAAGVFLYMKYQ